MDDYMEYTCCNTLQHTTTYCNTLPHTATHWGTYVWGNVRAPYTHTRCNTLQHAATRCNTLQHAGAHMYGKRTCSMHSKPLQHTAKHCNTLQHAGARMHGGLYVLPTFLAARLSTATHAWLLHALIPPCCSVLQCVAECCSVLQCAAVWCGVLQYVVVLHALIPLYSTHTLHVFYFWHKPRWRSRKPLDFQRQHIRMYSIP